MQLEIGQKATATTIVDSSNTAATLRSGLLEVFSTPSMIALMEQAAFTCLSPGLKDGQTSVGTKINVEHKMATPLGITVTATATITGIDRRSIDFEVIAATPAGEIGRGTHTRYIIDTEAFLEKVNQQQ